VGIRVAFVTLRFEDDADKLEEDNGNDAGVAPRRMLGLSCRDLLRREIRISISISMHHMTRIAKYFNL
jgi:hypothetical protein